MKTFKQYRELSESPYLNKDTKNHTKEDDFYTSDSALEREYNILYKKGLYTVYISKGDYPLIRVYIKDKEQKTQLMKNRKVGFINFYKKPIPKISGKQLQISLVDMYKEIEQQGFASSIYVKLLELGYTIISYNSQYLGGQMLWKKLAAESATSHYNVKIWNDGHKSYLLDKTGHVIEYNTHNIKDTEIWSTDWDFSKEDRLLVLSLK